MPDNKLKQAQESLRKLATPERAKNSAWFFKTGPGQYGEGDAFIGVTIPDTRKVAKKFQHLPLPKLKTLLSSSIHEERMLAIFILVLQFNKADEKQRTVLVDFYLANLSGINNWDLVDSSSYSILGVWLLDKNRAVLYKFAKSKNIWKRRIAIVSTMTFIRNGQLDDTFKIAELLLNDEHDLIQKAVGWLLREAGKKDERRLKKFLDKYHKTMPRTMLRYAIERFDESTRKHYLGKI